MLGNSRVTEQLEASQGLISMEFIGWLFGWLVLHELINLIMLLIHFSDQLSKILHW
jgi:hypothetical protein